MDTDYEQVYNFQSVKQRSCSWILLHSCSGGRTRRGHGLTKHYRITIGAWNNFVTSEFAGGRFSVRILSLIAKIESNCSKEKKILKNYR